MSITFPLSLPSAPGFRHVQISASNVCGAAVSPFTGQTQVFEWPAEIWSIDASLPSMRRDQAAAWVNFLLKLRGMTGTFLMGDPDGAEPQGVATGTPKVNGSNAAGSKTLATKGWTTGVSGILLAGDYIQVGTGTATRLYRVLTDANSDGSGHATLDIFPRLRETLVDNVTITTENCVGCFRLANNTRSWSLDTSLIYGIDFKAIEAL